MGKVSIIMPVYNAEKYLGEAIESVLKQTYPDFELLLINDASTDRSKEICVDYCKQDDRLVFLENNSKIHGPGPARNIVDACHPSVHKTLRTEPYPRRFPASDGQRTPKACPRSSRPHP